MISGNTGGACGAGPASHDARLPKDDLLLGPGLALRYQEGAGPQSARPVLVEFLLLIAV